MHPIKPKYLQSTPVRKIKLTNMTFWNTVWMKISCHILGLWTIKFQLGLNKDGYFKDGHFAKLCPQWHKSEW